MNIFIMLILILLCVCSYTIGYRIGHRDCKKKVEVELDKIDIELKKIKELQIELNNVKKDLCLHNV